jgi:SH3-like domain-containing protein
MKRYYAFGMLLIGLLTAGSVRAFDFVSVAEPAILYDAPSLKAKKLFVATRYLPLEKIVSLDNWVKVRDNTGKLFWIEKHLVSSRRYVVVTATLAAVRQSADANAEVIFRAPQQLALEWLDGGGNGWTKVRHLDGTSGFIKSTEVWGSR